MYISFGATTPMFGMRKQRVPGSQRYKPTQFAQVPQDQDELKQLFDDADTDPNKIWLTYNLPAKQLDYSTSYIKGEIRFRDSFRDAVEKAKTDHKAYDTVKKLKLLATHDYHLAKVEFTQKGAKPYYVAAPRGEFTYKQFINDVFVKLKDRFSTSKKAGNTLEDDDFKIFDTLTRPQKRSLKQYPKSVSPTIAAYTSFYEGNPFDKAFDTAFFKMKDIYTGKPISKIIFLRDKHDLYNLAKVTFEDNEVLYEKRVGNDISKFITGLYSEMEKRFGTKNRVSGADAIKLLKDSNRGGDTTGSGTKVSTFSW